MKNFNEQIQRFGLIKMKKNYSTNINVKRKINGKKDINDSKNEIKNNTINKNTIKTNSLTSKSNFINKKTPIKH